jgi:hypothetical protein
MIPSYGQSLIDNPALCKQVRAETAAVLKINDINTKRRNSSFRLPEEIAREIRAFPLQNRAMKGV